MKLEASKRLLATRLRKVSLSDLDAQPNLHIEQNTDPYAGAAVGEYSEMFKGGASASVSLSGLP